MTNVAVERTGGHLSDHYDPSSLTLRLSDSTADSTSVAALGVAAHECGHVLQHRDGYGPLMLRTAAVPVVGWGSNLAWPLFLLGFVGATPVVRDTARRIGETRVGMVLELLVLIVLLLVCTGYLVDGSFSPFLYFRF